jgi:Arc/MetJ-type ribon-helix-helix transcriptional regulator
MATVQVQVRLPREMVREIDQMIREGKFVSRSEAIKTVLAIYQEKRRVRGFYEILVMRSKEAKKKSNLLVPLEEVS